MKKHLLKFILPLIFLSAFLGISGNSFGQTITFGDANTVGNGITQGTLNTGTTANVVYGFTVKVTGTANHIIEFHLSTTGNVSGLDGYFSNFKLYKTTGTTFSSATQVSATIGFYGTSVDITGLSQSLTLGTTYTFFIVCDFPGGYGTLPTTVQFNLNGTQAVIQDSPTYQQFAGSNLPGKNYTMAAPSYTLTSANAAANGITQGTLTPSQTDVVLFGYGVTVAGSATISGFSINSSTAPQSYFTNGKLYKSTSNTFSSATLVGGATVAFNSTTAGAITVSGLTDAYNNNASPVYYFIVGDFTGAGSLPVTMQFLFQTSQTNAVVQSAPTSGNHAVTNNITGTNFTLSNPVYTLTDANTAGNGITPGTLRPGQTGMVLFGFGVSTSGPTTVSGFTLLATAGNPQSYFTNGSLYKSATNTFSSATLVSGAVVSFGSSTSPGITVSGLSESITTTTEYYFIVGDFSNSYYGTLSANMQFKFTTAQTNAFIQTGPVSANIAPTSNITGTNFTLDIPSIAITGYNSSSNGITQGVLQYQQTGIVLFGFGIAVTGGLTVNQINIPNTNSDTYFGNGILYSSPSSVFSLATATPISGLTMNFYTDHINITGLNEVFNTYTSTTTKYYFVVADYSQIATTSGTIQFDFNTSQSPQALLQTANSKTFNTFTVTNGTIFSLGLTYEWAGSTTSFTTAGNFRNLYNSAVGSAPGVNDQVRIGVNTMITNTTATAQPTIAANTTITRLIFGNVFTPQLTIASGVVLTTSSDVTVNASTSPTLTGGTLAVGGNLTHNGTTLTQGTTVVTVAGTLTNAGTYAQNGTGTVTAGALTNSGTYNQSSSGTLSVTGLFTNSGTYNQSNTGTVTAASLSNSGSYHQTSTSNLSVTGAMTNAGTYNQTNSGSLTVGGTLTNNTTKTITLNTSTTTLNGDVSNAGIITQGTGAFDFNGTTFNNSGTFTITSGPNTFGGTTFTNTGTFTPGTAAITFDHAGATSLSTTPALTLNNLTFSGGGTKTLTSGSFNIGTTGTLTMSGATTLNANGNLTLKSAAASTATIGIIPAGASITGNVTAERYIPAGNRGYRLFSSPVSNRTSASPYTAGLRSYDLTNLQTYTILTGPAGSPTVTSNGFTTSPLNNPSVFVYNETLSTPVNNNVSTSDYKGFATTSEYIPAGNGILFFYRGNQNTTKTGGSGNAFNSPYPTPEATTVTWVGTVNTGTINVNRPIFKAGAAYYNVLGTATGLPASTGVSITGSSTSMSHTTTALPGTDGFNLVGNPFPSTVDLEKITLVNLKGAHPTIYTLNSVNGLGFGTYTLSGTGNGASSTNGTANNGGSRYLLSGEGFFVQTLVSNATVTFPEAAKTAYPAGTAGTVSGPPIVYSLKDKNPSLRIKLVQDSVFYNETQINFSDQTPSTFNDDDVYYLTAPSQVVFMYSNTDDGSPCIINNMSSLENVKKISLYAEGSVTGTYQMQFSNANTIDSRYRIFLKDAFTKDSLDVTANTTYNFIINRANAATYGASRFTLVVYKDNNAAYKLVSFIGNKVNQTAKLTWTVQNESDVMSFDLERSIDGGKTFINIGSVQSNSLGTYSFTDPNPVIGDNIYRLSQSDVADAITYSNLVTLTFEDTTAPGSVISVYPNPTDQKINIDFTQPILNSLEVHIVSTSGKLVKNVTFNATQHIEQDVSNLQTGIYIVDVFDSVTNKKIGSLKFIKL